MDRLKVGIIADDWTGACDSGVQLVKTGMRVYAVSEPEAELPADAEALVFDTDSRALPRVLAYSRVRQVAETLATSGVRLVYKKMDSTLRGNVGAELDAVYDALTPDLVVIAPAFPAMGRCLIDGHLYVQGQPLNKTAVATDPRTPVTDSNMLRLLAQQTSRAVGLVTIAELSSDSTAVLVRLAGMREQGIRYVVFDSETDEHLRKVVKLVGMSGLKVVWAGSAGLASHLPLDAGKHAGLALPSIPPGKPTLVVIGSVHDRSRRQLQVLLQEQKIAGIGLSPEMALDAAAGENEITRVVGECREAIEAGRRVVLYMKAERGFAEGERSGRDRDETSRLIAEMLGEAAVQAVRLCRIERLVLTGGDTAKQVGSRLGATFSRLLGEVETGVPISRLGETNIYAVTKAGGFGSDDVFIKACRYLEGGSL